MDQRCAGCGRSPAEVTKLMPARAGEPTMFICDLCIAECSNAMGDAPTRIPGATRACSFCGKPEDYVALVISVGRKLICDECVDFYRAR